MFANFTEETCTGTGSTLALTGANTGNIAFSESYSDGDLVAYVLEDSGGTIKISGVGTYVSATDDITRNDTWNWNGTVIDNNPATNITLSVGTHTVRCTDHKTVMSGQSRTPSTVTLGNYDYYGDFVGNTSIDTIAWTLDRCTYEPIYIGSCKHVSGLFVKVLTLDATNPLVIAGIYSTDMDGLPDKLLDSVTFNVTTTGVKSVSFSSTLKLDAGMYVLALACDSATPAFEGLLGHQAYSTTYAPWGVNSTNSNRHYIPFEDLTSGWSSLPASPSIDFAQPANRTNIGLTLL